MRGRGRGRGAGLHSVPSDEVKLATVAWSCVAVLTCTDKQWGLQKQIVGRMVALGMTPVLPAFNG